jgi:hypothetical protein
MNIALFCTYIWHQVVHLLLPGAMVNYFMLFCLFYFYFMGIPGLSLTTGRALCRLGISIPSAQNRS